MITRWPSQDFGPFNFRGNSLAQLKTVALNTRHFNFTIFRMFYFHFAPNFLSHTWCIVLNWCDVLWHLTKIEVVRILSEGEWSTEPCRSHSWCTLTHWRMETNEMRGRIEAAPHWCLAAGQIIGSSRAEDIKLKRKYSSDAQKHQEQLKLLLKMPAIFKPSTSATATVSSRTDPTVNTNTEEAHARADSCRANTPSTSVAGTSTEDPDPPGQSKRCSSSPRINVML